MTSQFFNALTLGSIFALIALGYTMVYGIIELINFAHGDVFMVGAFVSMTVLTTIRLHRAGEQTAVISSFGLAAAFAHHDAAAWASWASLIERFAYRPLRNAPRLAPLITAIGVSFILQNLVPDLARSVAGQSVPQIFPVSARFELFGASIAWISVFVVRGHAGADGRPPAVHLAVAHGASHALDRAGP